MDARVMATHAQRTLHNITSIIRWNDEIVNNHPTYKMPEQWPTYACRLLVERLSVRLYNNLTENALNQVNGHVHLASPLASVSSEPI